MRIYTEVLIESAEQAEALAYGTVARRDVGSRVEVMVKHAPWTWWVGGEQLLRVGPEVAIGFEALVPIEVEAFQSEPLRTTHLVEGITGPGPFTVYVTQGDAS